MSAVTGAALGAVGGVGLWLVLSASPGASRPRLHERLAPYLGDGGRPSRLLGPAATVTPFPSLERIVRPVLTDVAGALERWLGGTPAVRRRLDQLGAGITVEQFRIEQAIWGTAGLAAGLALAVTSLGWGSRPSPVALLLTCLALAATGVLLRDRQLTTAVARRADRMLAEFPTVAELLALAVTAGEGPVAALERITRVCGGEIAAELRRALNEAHAGASLVQALQGLATRSAAPALSRFVDGVAVAVERGTPLADVLRAQAVDVRAAGKRELLESAGRREIAMMVPVVFLVLPVTVVFALFPGFYGLRLVAG